jgi:ATP-dependent Clp protease ATP-binding subunit ClpA
MMGIPVPMTPRTKKALSRAQQVATEAGACAIEPEHLLIALADDKESVPSCVLAILGVHGWMLGTQLTRPAASHALGWPVPQSEALRELLRVADEERAALQANPPPPLIFPPDYYSSALGPDAPDHLLELAKRLDQLPPLAGSHDYLGPEHLLLAITRLESGRAFEMLAALQVDGPQIRAEILRII